jgi:hypothetical protein
VDGRDKPGHDDVETLGAKKGASVLCDGPAQEWGPKSAKDLAFTAAHVPLYGGAIVNHLTNAREPLRYSFPAAGVTGRRGSQE